MNNETTATCRRCHWSHYAQYEQPVICPKCGLKFIAPSWFQDLLTEIREYLNRKGTGNV